MPVKYFQVEGIATFVHHAGTTTLPGAPPRHEHGEVVLFLHGGAGNGAVFRESIDALAEAHCPIAFDQPGHGRSGGLDSLGSIERMAAFSGAFADKLGLPPQVLVGHSMGGAVALQLALERPDRVRALVLCGAAARFEISEETFDQARRITEGKARRSFNRDAYGPEATREAMQRGFMEDLKTDPRVDYGDMLARADFDVEARLSEIAVPTLVVVGEHEREAFRAQADLLEQRIAGAQKVVVAGAGHMLPLEDPAALARAIGDFLGAIRP